MAQHIGCILEDENHKLLRDSGLNFASINGVLWELDPKLEKYKWLGSIAQFDDTTFNHLQVPFVIAELERLKSKTDHETQNLIREFIQFIENNDGHYIKFIGD